MFLTTLSFIDGLAINVLFEDPRRFFISTLIVVFSICLHEFCHAFAALKMGDPTAAENGHLTLNPLKQMGITSILMLLIIGIAWGAVPVNPQNIRSRWKALLISVAGPLANLFLFAVGWSAFGILMNHFSDVKPIVLEAVLFFGLINGVLFLFNMLPVPGLDGWAVVQVFFRKIRLPDSEVLKGVFMILIFAAIFGLKYLVRLAQIVMLTAPAFFAVKSLPDDARRGELRDVAIPLHTAYWNAEPPEAAFYQVDEKLSVSRVDKSHHFSQCDPEKLDVVYCVQYGDIGSVIIRDKEQEDTESCIGYIMVRKDDDMWYLDWMQYSSDTWLKFHNARRNTPLPEGVTVPADAAIRNILRRELPPEQRIVDIKKEILYGGRDVNLDVTFESPSEGRGTIRFRMEYHDGGIGWQILRQK